MVQKTYLVFFLNQHDLLMRHHQRFPGRHWLDFLHPYPAFRVYTSKKNDLVLEPVEQLKLTMKRTQWGVTRTSKILRRARGDVYTCASQHALAT